VRNLIFANGFSGHGMQQSPAVGRGIAELIVHGRYRSLDLSELSVARLIDGRRVLEEGVV
jgi:FAD-dependent oxidoreductase domain-containing protein 1